MIYRSYFDVIKNPMDLSTVNAKVEAGMYKTLAQFEADMRLMINNAKTYNPAGAFAYNEALALDSFFEKGNRVPYILETWLNIFHAVWARIRNTLEHAGNLARPAPVLDEVESAIVSTLDVVREPVVVVPVRSEPVDSAPKIKLKLGSSKNSVPKVSGASPLPSTSRSNPSSSKAKEPVKETVDDLLLQEVIEMEQDRPPMEKKKEKIKIKEKEKGVSVPPIAKAHTPAATEAIPLMKVKKPTISLPGSASSSTPTSKAKALERAPTPQVPLSTASNIKRTSTPSMHMNDKKCREIIRILRKLPEAIIFNRPVDPEKDGCPT